MSVFSVLITGVNQAFQGCFLTVGVGNMLEVIGNGEPLPELEVLVLDMLEAAGLAARVSFMIGLVSVSEYGAL